MKDKENEKDKKRNRRRRRRRRGRSHGCALLCSLISPKLHKTNHQGASSNIHADIHQEGDPCRGAAARTLRGLPSITLNHSSARPMQLPPLSTCPSIPACSLSYSHHVTCIFCGPICFCSSVHLSVRLLVLVYLHVCLTVCFSLPKC